MVDESPALTPKRVLGHVAYGTQTLVLIGIGMLACAGAGCRALERWAKDETSENGEPAVWSLLTELFTQSLATHFGEGEADGPDESSASDRERVAS